MSPSLLWKQFWLLLPFLFALVYANVCSFWRQFYSDAVFYSLWGCHCESDLEGGLGVMGFVHTFPTKDRVTGWPLLPTINCSFQYPGKADATRVHILHQEAVRQVKHWTQSVWSLPGSCRLHYPILDVYDIVSVILKYNKAVLIP